ncbi:MAG: redoxin domain-containing protein [Planctomycetota bacterium]
MNRRKTLAAFLLTTPLLCFSLAMAMPQQMEKRDSEEFDAEQFYTSRPTVGDAAPDMELRTLDGETVSLSDYRGRNIVVIKAGYT